MGSFRAAMWSSVGKKILTGLTGIGLMVFIVGHLVGNMTLFISADAFNHYAYFLEHLIHGWFLFAFEVGMLILIGIHIVSAITVAVVDKLKARPAGYELSKNAGYTSRKTLSSTTMIYTGVALGAFITWHVAMFRFGDPPLIPLEDGGHMRDLYTLVVLSFKELWITALYVLAMVLLGFHLRHGFWSAFQSMGWASQGALRVLTGLALVFALLMAIGFIILPLAVYFFFDVPAQAAALGGL